MTEFAATGTAFAERTAAATVFAERTTARRVADIAPFQVMEVMALAQRLERDGKDIIHLEVGEPDFDTAAPIVDAGIAALRRGDTHYTLALGLRELRAAIGRFYQDRYQAVVPPERVAVTCGASGALQLTVWSLIDPGDEVLLADPGYPCNHTFVRVAGGVPVTIPVDATTQWQVTADLIEARLGEKTRAVMIASPSNPTGTLIAPDELRKIASLLAERGVALISDEIYHGLVYSGEAATAAGLPGEVFVINSFSKYFGMTGWRLGWLLAPAAHMRNLEKLAQNLFISPPTPAQHAALAAFQPATIEILEGRRREFERRRDLLLPALRALGFGLSVVPQGAFYLYADCRALHSDSHRLVTDLLTQAGVAMTPGMDFGRQGAASHLRLAYTTSYDRLQEGIARLERFFR